MDSQPRHYPMNFDQAFTKLFGHEGGYVNNPADPGGETKFGITKRSYPHLDIKNLTPEQAKAIYLPDYWKKSGCDRLPPALRYAVFDMAVHSGVVASVRMLQQLLSVPADGVFGPITERAANAARVEPLLVNFYAKRLEFLTSLPNWPAFSRGWVRRIATELKEMEWSRL